MVARTTMEKRTVAEMIGDFWREVAVLLAVFWPLDKALRGEHLTLRSAGPILALAVAFFTLGVVIERRR